MSLKNKKESKPEVTPEKSKVILVKLLKGQQFQCPDTKVIFKIDQQIPVTEISGWMKFQESVGLLEIIE